MAESKTSVTTTQVYEIYIQAEPQAIWDAITKPEWTARYGYRPVVNYDLREGGKFEALAGDGMPGMSPDACVVEGKVLESDPPHRLVQTWRPTWLDEPFTTVTYEIKEGENGVCSLTLTHDLHDAPQTAAQTSGNVEGAGGGWPEVLSDMKSLLETGSGMYA